MPYDWNTTAVAEWDLIKDPDVWNGHIAAIQERCTICDPSGNTLVGIGSGGSGITTVADGANIQTSEWWAKFPQTPERSSPPVYYGMQAAIASIAGSFVNQNTTFEGYTTELDGNFAPVSWSLPTLRAAASLPTLYQYVNVTPPDASGTFTTPPTANSTWRRKRPREVYFSPFVGFADYAYHDDYDVQGNVATVDQHAWHFDGLVDSLSFTISGGTGLFTCTAAAVGSTHAVWARATVAISGTTVSPIVDMLDNASDYPNTVACALSTDAATFYGAFITVYPDDYTNMVCPGDYVGFWLFDEVRSITNLLRWTAQLPSPTKTSYYASVSSAISYADAISQLAGAWGPGTPAGSPLPGFGSGAYVDASWQAGSGAGTWFVVAQRWEATDTVSGLPTTHKQIDTYLYAKPMTNSTGSTTFNAQGDGLTNGAYHKIDTSSITTATSYTTPTFGGITLPTNNPPDPATSGNARLGYYASDALGVIRYDVTGGLAYLF